MLIHPVLARRVRFVLATADSSGLAQAASLSSGEGGQPSDAVDAPGSDAGGGDESGPAGFESDWLSQAEADSSEEEVRTLKCRHRLCRACRCADTQPARRLSADADAVALVPIA